MKSLSDVLGALLVSVALVVLGAIPLFIGQEKIFYLTVGAFIVLAFTLSRNARLFILVAFLPLASVQIIRGIGLYRLYDLLFVILFIEGILLVDLFRWRRIPVLGWPAAMFIAFLPSLVNVEQLGISLAALLQFAIVTLTAAGVYYYLVESRYDRLIFYLSAFFVIEAAVTGAIGILQALRSSLFVKFVSGRVYFAPFGDANYYATYLLTAFAIGIALVFIQRTLTGRLLLSGSVGVIAVAIIATLSRSGWLTFVLIVLLYAIYFFVSQKGSRKIIGFAVLASVVAIIGLVVFTNIGGRLVDLMNLSTRAERALTGKDTSFEQRRKIIEVTWRAIKSNPIVGVGFGNFERAFNSYRGSLLSTESSRSVHNTPLRIFAETGIVGLIPSLLFVWFLFTYLWKAHSAVETFDAKVFLFGLIVALASFLMMSMTLDQLAGNEFWVITGIALAASTKALQGRSILGRGVGSASITSIST